MLSSTQPCRLRRMLSQTLEELDTALSSWQIPQSYQCEVARFRSEWDQEVDRIFARRHGPPLSQGEVIGLLNATLGPRDIIVNAAGSLSGDLAQTVADARS